MVDEAPLEEDLTTQDIKDLLQLMLDELVKITANTGV